RYWRACGYAQAANRKIKLFSKRRYVILLNLLKQEDELTKRKEKIKLSLDAYDSTNRTKNTKRNSQNPNILIKRFDLIHKNLIVLTSLCYNDKQLSE
ncbi:hypothetical protein KQJ29_31690, partial [Enterococcus sp. S181_ASV_20]|nr:hypothetical protein [Enterococcus sp. S181_ASV_20]